MGEAKRRAAQRERERLTRVLPENIDGLNRWELEIRSKTVAAIEKDPELMDHIVLAETVMDTLEFFSVRKPVDLDQETVQLLGTRVFNDLAAITGLLLRGYYQVAAATLRDVMEIVFLLGMFHRDRSTIKLWRESDHETRRKSFQPWKVRRFLDTYDGFTEGKRGKAYQMFCEYAAHATYSGFALMGPTDGQPTIGPFFDPPLTKALLFEQAQLAAQAGNNYVCFFDADKDVKALGMKLRRLDVTSSWAERYFERQSERTEINKLKKMLAEIKANE